MAAQYNFAVLDCVETVEARFHILMHDFLPLFFPFRLDQRIFGKLLSMKLYLTSVQRCVQCDMCPVCTDLFLHYVISHWKIK